jgi:hypothetical protein
MKKWIVLCFICAAVAISCGKKMMPESGANNQSKPVNDKEAKSTTQSANTNTSATETPSINDMKGFQTVPIENIPRAVSMDAEKTVYVTKCNSCHALKTPSDYTNDQMRNILKTEIPKANLSTKEAQQVTVYLLANTKK